MVIKVISDSDDKIIDKIRMIVATDNHENDSDNDGKRITPDIPTLMAFPMRVRIRHYQTQDSN